MQILSLNLQNNTLERIWLLARIEFKLRYYENRLGLLWAVFKPLMEMCIYYIAFKTILKTDIENFASYLFLGLIVWNFFVETTSGNIQTLINKRHLYEYSNMNKIEIYISNILSSCIGFGFNLTVFLIFNALFGNSPHLISWHAIYIIPLFISLFLLGLGIAMILSSLYIVAKDVSQIWQVCISFLFFLSPVFYKLSVFRSSLQIFEYINPISGLVINIRNILLLQTQPDFLLMGFNFLYGLLFLVLGGYTLKKLGAKASEKL